ncbi:hypothetical protein I0C86_40675 [Plantactinospora sp. S1510]|uniref:DUF4129 domain-containing protein n=1 Tax=Plantactinospora alkalitolerans TaxID=2789879 RepID=A0ABS0HAA9_9ACTN|nr:hypothetical protein [Plantactinospora alkalitolerans]MBF9135196.1 hypothetical protein [Plantactinospora alkalitolerans]
MSVAIGQREPDPNGGTTGGELPLDVPPFVPDPTTFEHVTTFFAARPMLAVAVAAALVVAVALPLAGLLGWLLARRAKRAAPDATLPKLPEDDLDSERSRAERDAYRLYIFGSLVSLASGLHVLQPALGTSVFAWTLALSVATVLEIAIVVFYRLGRIRIRESGKAGVEGAAPWFIALVSALYVSYEIVFSSGNLGLALARMIVPVIVATTLTFLLLARQRKWRRENQQPVGDNEQADAETIEANPLRTMWRRFLVRWGLVDDKGVIGSSLIRRRKVMRVARLAYLAEKGADDKVKSKAKAQFDVEFPKIVERYGPDVTAQLSEFLAILIQARQQLTAARAQMLDVWRPVSPASVSASSSAPRWTSTSTDSPGSGSTDRETVLDGDTSTDTAPERAPVPPADQDSTGTDTAGKSSTAKARGNRVEPMTWAEVARLRESWESGDLFARKLDIQVAEAYAAKVGREAAKAHGMFNAGMRLYTLVMVAAGHHPKFNATEMYRAVTGKDLDTGCQGRKQQKLYLDQLGAPPADFDRWAEELRAEGGTSATSTGGAQ